MSTIRLEHDKFNAAPMLAALLNDRLLSVSEAGSEAAGDMKSTTYVCSAAFEASVGGEEAAVARGRASRAGRMMIIEEDASAFAVTEALGGKLIRLALPAVPACGVADHYGLQLAATLLSDERTVACGDQISRDLLALARRVAKTDVTVFINGPTGTGKEVLARALHDASPRAGHAFVAINCGAMPEQLLESELFGHEKGAFTDAKQAQQGLFRSAEGGTVFLDEIGDMPLALQVKLLRVLQEREVRPVGSQRSLPVNVRVISATHRNLSQAIDAQQFREDLYYRLAVVTLALPSLRERPEDIAPLARHFLDGIARRSSRRARVYSPDAMERLCQHHWPGNIRQLSNVVEQNVALTRGHVISPQAVDKALAGHGGRPGTKTPTLQPLAEARDAFVRDYLIQLLRISEGNVARSARLAKRNRTEFYKLLNRHEIDPADYKH